MWAQGAISGTKDQMWM